MLQLTWLVLLGVVVIGYVVGLHIYGIQMLAPFLDHRLPRGRKDTLSALTPRLLLHEAWLIGVAVLLAVIPWLSSDTLPGLLTVIAAWLAGLLVGDIAARLRKRVTPGIARRTITAVSATGAAVATAATGWGAGLLLGMPEPGADHSVALTPAMSRGPFAPLCAAICVALAITHGATYLAWTHVGTVAARARVAGWAMAIVSAVMIAASALSVLLGWTPPVHYWRGASICAVIILGSVLCGCLLGRAGRPGRATAATSIAAAVPTAVACGLSPQILVLSQGPHYPGKTTMDFGVLSALLVLAVVVVPLLVCWGRWVLRGRSARGFTTTGSWWRRSSD